ncbi:hypothetical protein [Burkholderia guangdongensis]|uniref:hypothetical protein n=1 Tax=Burkholderia guangdongensis TaxID=1792500 RepID=UPI0015C7E795|nr:hypothetical protein [Burkholderia guangdongensis]
MAAAIADTFANDVIQRCHGTALNRYIRLKAIGRSSIAALSGAFGADYSMSMNPHVYIDLIETSDAYVNGLPHAIEALKDHSIWNAEISARVLASIATDESAKRSDRIAAAKELNVIYGVTVIDENGKTKAGMTLDDLLKMTPSAAPVAKVH